VQTPHHQIVDVPRDEIRQGVESGALLVVDVREPEEYARGHIPGSLLMPLSAFDFDLLRALDKRVVFSCAAGVRSLHAAEMALAAGLGINEHYRGGFYDWARAGEPVETGY
jgi:rhodanese-related sulfurtransferase